MFEPLTKAGIYHFNKEVKVTNKTILNLNTPPTPVIWNSFTACCTLSLHHSLIIVFNQNMSCYFQKNRMQKISNTQQNLMSRWNSCPWDSSCSLLKDTLQCWTTWKTCFGAEFLRVWPDKHAEHLSTGKSMPCFLAYNQIYGFRKELELRRWS